MTTLQSWIALRARVHKDIHHMGVALDAALIGERIPEYDPVSENLKQWEG